MKRGRGSSRRASPGRGVFADGGRRTRAATRRPGALECLRAASNQLTNLTLLQPNTVASQSRAGASEGGRARAGTRIAESMPHTRAHAQAKFPTTTARPATPPALKWRRLWGRIAAPLLFENARGPSAARGSRAPTLYSPFTLRTSDVPQKLQAHDRHDQRALPHTRRNRPGRPSV